jgi:putative acetyltransferase
VFAEGDPADYQRPVFTPAGELGSRRPSLRIPPPAFQVLALAHHDPSLTGTLVCPKAFWDTTALRSADQSQNPANLVSRGRR